VIAMPTTAEDVFFEYRDLQRRGVRFDLIDGRPCCSQHLDRALDRDARLFLLAHSSAIRDLVYQDRVIDPDGVMVRALRKDT